MLFREENFVRFLAALFYDGTDLYPFDFENYPFFTSTASATTCTPQPTGDLTDFVLVCETFKEAFDFSFTDFSSSSSPLEIHPQAALPRHHLLYQTNRKFSSVST